MLTRIFIFPHKLFAIALAAVDAANVYLQDFCSHIQAQDHETSIQKELQRGKAHAYAGQTGLKTMSCNPPAE